MPPMNANRPVLISTAIMVETCDPRHVWIAGLREPDGCGRCSVRRRTCARVGSCQRAGPVSSVMREAISR
jgi:hypothetical protein